MSDFAYASRLSGTHLIKNSIFQASEKCALSLRLKTGVFRFLVFCQQTRQQFFESFVFLGGYCVYGLWG
jgi:hypothetical protein